MGLTEQLQLVSTKGIGGMADFSAASLPDQIAAVLRNRIIYNKLQPGSPIRERQLADALSVSRTPLRDALKILALDKLVEHVPNKGAVVVDPTIDDISDMLQVYIELDAFGGRLACRVGSEADFLKVERQMQKMDKATVARDRLTYFQANQNFHLAILAASRSETTIEFHQSLNLRLHRVRYLSILKDDQWMNRSGDHENFLQALRDRDIERFSAIQKRHFSVAWRLVDAWASSEST